AGAPVAGAAPAPAGRVPRRSGRDGPSRLVVTEGPLRGTTLPLGASAVLVGRAPSCTLVLDDDYSSSRHARVFPHEGGWWVEDLGSTNGTWVDEQRITEPVPLRTGVAVRVGQSVLELQR
ncbi:FHA domain-containing protein FhaB/FipA, partial [Cellulomonas endophytica]|uniref:FHA domain-containing protein FhaB/FipA n=1 Tax=Cellulomonas endophytica TaxID=2494735 RepID=UPI0013E966B3